MTYSITPFKSKSELIQFGCRFVRNRVDGFRKDIAICRRADRERRHAYFPALITCVGLLELLSGLYIGKLRDVGIEGLIKYVGRFIDKTEYTNLNMRVLYIGFRHKIAHLTYPYGVFDASVLSPKSRRLVTWRVYASRRLHALELVQEIGALAKDSPWPTPHTHRMLISIDKLKADIVKSTKGPNGYVAALKTRTDLQSNFAKCMVEFYPP